MTVSLVWKILELFSGAECLTIGAPLPQVFWNNVGRQHKDLQLVSLPLPVYVADPRLISRLVCFV